MLLVFVTILISRLFTIISKKIDDNRILDRIASKKEVRVRMPNGIDVIYIHGIPRKDLSKIGDIIYVKNGSQFKLEDIY